MCVQLLLKCKTIYSIKAYDCLIQYHDWYLLVYIIYDKFKFVWLFDNVIPKIIVDTNCVFKA